MGGRLANCEFVSRYAQMLIGQRRLIQSRLKSNDRESLLHQQPARECEAFRSRGPQSLGHRKHLPLVPGCHVPGRRITHPREEHARDFCLAQSLHSLPAQAASRSAKHRHETKKLRLERRLPASSPYRKDYLVSAGPRSIPAGGPTS